MKVRDIIALIILSTMYLSPDFDRLLNSVPTTGSHMDYSIQKNVKKINCKTSSYNFQRRRFIPPIKTNENVKLSSIVLTKFFFQPILNECNIISFVFSINYTSITFAAFENKAPPIIYC
jgi:hypothetical protein